jgi:hypothetical protein
VISQYGEWRAFVPLQLSKPSIGLQTGKTDELTVYDMKCAFCESQPAKKVLKKTTTTTTKVTTTKTVKGAKPSGSTKPKKDPLFQSAPKNFRLGGDIQV